MPGTRRLGRFDRPEESHQRPLDLTVGGGAQVLFRRMGLAEVGLACQQIDASRLQSGQGVEGRGVAHGRAQREDGSTDALAPALLDRADRAPGVAELRKDGAAHLGRIAEACVVLGAFEGRRRLGIVEQEIAPGRVDALEPGAAQPARAADALLHVLVAVPVFKEGIVRRIDVDPNGEDRLTAAHVALTACVKETTSLRRLWSAGGA